MHEVNLRELDLNLLVTLQALLEEQHVTRAAERLDMSQPAVSRALARLRETFNDPLLVKSIQGYDLSTRAESLRPRLNILLRDISLLVKPAQFDPLTATDSIDIACLDLEGTLFLPPAFRKMRSLAPNMKLKVHSQPGEHFRLLQQAEVDYVISALQPQSGEGQIISKPLAKTSLVCLMDRDNPLASKDISLEDYVSARHGVVSITGLGTAIMDKLLEEKGLSRKVILRANSFMTIPDYVRGTDLIFALPELTANRLSRDTQLITKALPHELRQPPVTFYLYWHQRNQKDPMHVWIRSTLLASDKVQTNHKPE